MADDGDKKEPGPSGNTGSGKANAEKADRMAEALRANLRKRKAQARGRRTKPAD